LQQVVDIRLAEARGYTGEQSVAEAIVQAAQRLIVNILLPAAFIAHNLAPFNANQRSDIAEPA
jgi:hypothetical protein